MKHFVIVVLGVSTLLTSGCAPLAIAGGIAVVSMISQDIERQKAARRIEHQRQASLRQRAEEQQRTRLAALENQRKEEVRRRQIAELERQKRLAEQEQQRKEDARRRQIADFERQQRFAQQQRRQAELAKQQQAATDEARRLLGTIEASLKEGRWSRSELPALLRAVDGASNTSARNDVLGRVRLGTGLYAFLLDQRAIAAKEWRAARRLGAHNPRIVTAAVWTPGAIEAFKGAD